MARLRGNTQAGAKELGVSKSSLWELAGLHYLTWRVRDLVTWRFVAGLPPQVLRAGGVPAKASQGEEGGCGAGAIGAERSF